MAELSPIFPSDYASNSEKKNKEYGRQIGEAITSQWFTGQLSHRRYWINLMRSYSRGEQDVQQYKDTIEGKKENREGSNAGLRTHKIDYKQLKILPSFKDIVNNAIDESLFKPRAEAIDITAVDEKKKFFKNLDKNFYTKDFSQIISQGIGVDITPKNIPRDERELVSRKLEYKPRIEIAQELAIENVMKLESFEAIKDKIDEDLFDLGHGVGRHYTDYNEGIKLKYVDPYDYISNTFQTDDGKDIRYHGIVEKDTFTNLAKLVGGISPEDEKTLKEDATGVYESKDAHVEEEDGSRMIEYINFAYLVGEEKIYKKLRKNKTTKVVDRSKDGYEPSNPNKKFTIPYQVWYEGVYVPSAKLILQWRKIPNQVEKEVNKPISPFILYAPKVKRLSEDGYIRFDSLTNRAIPIIDDLHRDWFKFQQLKMELRPNTTEIDVDAINDVVLNGQKIAPQDLLDLFFGRSLLLKKTVDEDGDPLPRAITESAGGINNTALGFLTQEFANNYERLRQLLGINELRDGTTKPNSKTAVAVQKILLASSNNATNHIVKASFNISLRFAEAVSYRLYDVLTTPALKNRYLSVIGTSNVELLDDIKKLPMHKFGIYFDFKPDNEERLAFENSLINAYNNKEINVAQYNTARQVRNVKSAIKYLEYVVDENSRIEEEKKLRNIEAQAKANAQTSVVAEQTKQQTLTVSYDIDKQKMLLQSEIDANSKKQGALIEDLLAERQHQRNMELELVKSNTKKEIEKGKEEARKDRIDQTSTNTSKIVDQKEKGTEPIDFQNKLDGIFTDNSLPIEQ